MENTFVPTAVLPVAHREQRSVPEALPPTWRQILVSRVTRLFLFYSGCGTVANHRWVQKLAGECNGKIWARVQGGEIIAPMNDHVGRAAYFCGDLDPKVTWVCRQLVREGDTVLDIGANIGVTTVGLASMVGKTGRVHSFEPNPELQWMLRQVIKKNELSQVTLHAMALGAADSEMELRVPRENLGMGSLVRHGKAGDAVYQVPVRRLTDIVAQEGITSIRFIKIDVEGFEADVFNGATEVLEKLAPEGILFELNMAPGSFSEQPVVEVLRRAGYDFLSVPRRLVRMNLCRLDESKPLERGGNDYLAVRRGETFERIARQTGAWG